MADTMVWLAPKRSRAAMVTRSASEMACILRMTCRHRVESAHEVDIGALVAEGANTVEVRVTDLWVNRLIGDAQAGVKKMSFAAPPG
jgi:hypothetical protein